MSKYNHHLCIYFVIVLAGLLLATPVDAKTAEARVTPAHDAADAQNVRLLNHIGGSADAIFVVGVRAYIGEGYRLTILDTSDPIQPVVLGKSAFLPDIIRAIVVVGEYAYVADDYGGLRILDVSKPPLPWRHNARLTLRSKAGRPTSSACHRPPSSSRAGCCAPWCATTSKCSGCGR